MGTCTVSGDALNSNFVIQTSTNWLMRKSSGLYQRNGGGRSMGMLACTKGQIITIVGTGDPNPTTNATLKSSSDKTYVYTVNDDGDVKFTPARYLYFTSITVENPSASAVAYTVKYVDGEGNQIKTATEGSAEPGSSVTVSEVEKAAIYTDGKKYVYDSDDSEGMTVNADGTTVVTLKFTESEVYNYTVNFLAGAIMESVEGKVFAGEEATVYVPRFIFDDENNTLYSLKTAYEFTYKFTPAADKAEENVTFNAEEENSNAYFFSEAEDIDGVTAYEDGFTQVRMANGAVGIADSVAVAALEPGIYTITSSTRSGSTDFYVDGEKVFTLTSTGAVVVETSDQFTVKESTELYAKNVVTPNNSNYFDYLLIRKTGDYNYLTIEGELPDSVTANVGEVPSMAELHPQSNAVEITTTLNVAEGSEGADKAAATYSSYTSEEGVKDVLSVPGIYYIYASFTGTFADGTTQTVNTDTIVATIVEPNYLNVEQNLPDTLTITLGEDDFSSISLTNYVEISTNAPVKGAAVYVAEGGESIAKEEANYVVCTSDEDIAAALSEPGTYYAFAKINVVYADNTTDEAITDTIVIVVKEKEAEPQPVVDHTFSFGNWSEATITNLKAEAAKVTVSDVEGKEGTTQCVNNDATWSDHEKAPDKDCNTYAASKDNCFWFFGSANADGQLEANGEVIEELKGLTFDNATYNAGRSIAIAVNYASTSLGDYNGGSYLWLGGSNGGFTIKNVKRGTTITMGVESHKPSDARGVKLSVDGTELVDPEGNEVAVPTVYEEQTWAVPAAAAEAKAGALSANADDDVVDVVVTNTSGCHIYFIDAEIGEATPTAVGGIAEADAAVKADGKFIENGQIIIVKGGKKYNAAGAVIK